jgi:rhodanese-related sulfurtransferase
VVVVCSHGARALSAVRTLEKQGVEATSLCGGMSAWRRDGHPVDRPS